MSNPITTPFWKALEHILGRFICLFGMPARIAKLIVMSRPEHVVVARWLRGVEYMLRSLLLIDAVELVLTSDAPPPPREPRAKTAPRKSKPNTVRVSFRVFDTERRGRRRRHIDKQPTTFWPGVRLYNALPLAARLEACLAVFNEPETYVRRLAEKLRRKPSAAARINTHTDFHFRVIPGDIWMDMRQAFINAAHWLTDTS